MNCRSCNSSTEIREFINLGTSPASNAFINKDQLEQKYSKLVRPHVTGEAVPQYPIKNEN